MDRKQTDAPMTDTSEPATGGAAAVTSDLNTRLAARYQRPEWQLIFEFSPPGASMRRIDAAAVGLYGSRGCPLVGFEVKASRADWLRELKNHAKGDHATLFDQWFVVAPAGVVMPSELPVGWGLICPHGDGLRQRVPSNPTWEPNPKRQRAVLVRMIERGGIGVVSVPECQRRVSDAVANERARHADQARRPDPAAVELDCLRKRVADFEAASGLTIADRWSLYSAQQTGRAVAMLRRYGPDRLGQVLEQQAAMADKAAADLRRTQAAVLELAAMTDTSEPALAAKEEE